MDVHVTVEVEEVVYSDRYSNNGSNPMWCLGNTCLVRLGDDVYVSGYERLPKFKPLNDCRWTLLKRTADGWERQEVDEQHRTREPSPLAMLPGRLFLSANPTLLPPDRAGGGPARPEILEFNPADPKAPFKTILPQWQGKPAFGEHSYRTFAADAAAGELILFQSIGYSHAEWALLGRDGKWLAGRLRWPPYGPNDINRWGGTQVRVLYPTVVLRDRAVHFCGQAAYDNWDRVKTLADLHKYTGGDNSPMNWVFGVPTRRLLYSWTDRVGEKPFREWVEIDNAFKDGGSLWPCDMHLDNAGIVHVLWHKGPMRKEARDRWFPDIPLDSAIRYARVRDGKVVEKRTLVEAGEDREVRYFVDLPPPEQYHPLYPSGLKVPSGSVIAVPRFHVTPDERLFVVYYATGKRADGTDFGENRLLEVRDGRPTESVTIPLKHPLTKFYTPTPRAGCAPSWTLDLLGYRRGGWVPQEGTGNTEWNGTMSYARVRIVDHGM